MSPALAGGFLATVSPGKFLKRFFFLSGFVCYCFYITSCFVLVMSFGGALKIIYLFYYYDFFYFPGGSDG